MKRRRRLQALQSSGSSVGGSKVESKVTQEGRSHCWPHIAGGGRAGGASKEGAALSISATSSARDQTGAAGRLWEEYTLYLNATGL